MFLENLPSKTKVRLEKNAKKYLEFETAEDEQLDQHKKISEPSSLIVFQVDHPYCNLFIIYSILIACSLACISLGIFHEVSPFEIRSDFTVPLSDVY